jgi:hypothetical protein
MRAIAGDEVIDDFTVIGFTDPDHNIICLFDR